MFSKKSISRMFSVLLIVVFVLIGVLPVQAESLASPRYTSGDFILAKGMGGTNFDTGFSIFADSNDNLYVSGAFQGTVDFDPGVGVFELTSAGLSDIFVTKLDSNGNLIWAKSMSGTDDAVGCGMTLDSIGNIYTTGNFEGTVDFDPGAGTANLTSAGLDDIFVSKLDNNGNFVWARKMGGTNGESGFDIAIDSSGNVYTTGAFRGTADFNPGTGTANLTSAGEIDIFISKLNNSGNFVWAKRIGGTLNDVGLNNALDSSGNVYVTGYFKETVDFNPGTATFNLTSKGNTDVFVSKLDSSGNFVWAKGMGGTDYDIGQGLTIDASGNVYTTGTYTYTADFDPDEAGTFELTDSGDFISKLDSNGNFVFAKRNAGTYNANSGDIVIDSSGNIYTTGYFSDTADFDPGAGTFELSSAGDYDIFISKLNSSGDFIWAKSMGGADEDRGNSLVLSSRKDIYITGDFKGTVDFDPGAGVAELTSAGDSDIFISKLENGTPLVINTLTFSSAAANDGWALESSEYSSHANAKNNTENLLVGDNAKNRQYRSLLYFDTASLPDNAVISSLTVKIKQEGITGTDPFTTHGDLLADMAKGFFGKSPLENTDFQAKGAPRPVGSFAPVSGEPGWYELVLNPANFKYVNLAGVTQFRLRFSKDDNNNKVADFISFYSGEDATNPPNLIVEYYVP